MRILGKAGVILYILFTGMGGVVLPLPVQAQAGAVLKLAPSSGTFYVGSTFEVSIVVDTGPQAINAVAVELRFPPDVIQITNPAAGSSIVRLWCAAPAFSNTDGIVP